jgi:hypothetical protein
VAPIKKIATLPIGVSSIKDKYRLFSQKMEIFFRNAIGLTENSEPFMSSGIVGLPDIGK